MRRVQQHKNNWKAINRIQRIDPPRSWSVPSYESVVSVLNSEGLRTSRGNHWTRRRLYRMLQREGFRGLHGLFREAI